MKNRALIKAYINKTLIFLIGIIVVASHFFNSSPIFKGWYSGKPSLVMSEMVCILLLLNNIMIRKCFWSWIVFYLLMLCGFINIVYITTGLAEWFYDSFMRDLIMFFILLSSIISVFQKNEKYH